MSARRSQDVGESGVAVDGGRGSIGRKSSFGKGVSSVPVETNGVPYVRKSGSEKRPPPVVARSSAGSVASLQSLSKGGWGALEETTAVDDQWQYQGADDDGASSAATEELADAGDDGDTDEDTMIAPKNSSLQQRRRRPTKAGDETAGKTDYSIKQRNRRRDQVAQRLGVYSDDISEWLNELLKIDPPLVADTLMTSLETGVALCQLAHCVHKSIGSWRYGAAGTGENVDSYVFLTRPAFYLPTASYQVPNQCRFGDPSTPSLYKDGPRTVSGVFGILILQIVPCTLQV
jgi:hypothetical protein